jgi:hypothetical protein
MSLGTSNLNRSTWGGRFIVFERRREQSDLLARARRRQAEGLCQGNRTLQSQCRHSQRTGATQEIDDYPDKLTAARFRLTLLKLLTCNSPMVSHMNWDEAFSSSGGSPGTAPPGIRSFSLELCSKIRAEKKKKKSPEN